MTSTIDISPPTATKRSGISCNRIDQLEPVNMNFYSACIIL
jgi:hypothetical protein